MSNDVRMAIEIETLTATAAGAPPMEMEWGSDAMAATLRALDFPYAALVPGASFRGLHDSIVNYLGNETPRMLLCLHEEHAVAIAHGYARVTGKPMLAIVHSNVGLMHASMAIWNAWCSRTPVVIIGATGPLDAAKRRPWIDWIHTAVDQASLVRGFIKWDDTPASATAAIESIARAAKIASTAPFGPTYVVLDAGLQETPLENPLPMPDLTRFRAPRAAQPTPADIAETLAAVRAAKKPLLIVGRVARTLEAWNERVALAERLGLPVIADFKNGSVFPTTHALFVGQSGYAPASKALREADLVIDLDSIDLGGMLKDAYRNEPVQATIIASTLDHHLHGGSTMEYQKLAPVDIDITVGPDAFVHALLAAVPAPANGSANGAAKKPAATNGAAHAEPGAPISIGQFSHEFIAAFDADEISFTRTANGVNPEHLVFRDPLKHLGHDGGGGVGSGPGIAVGVALALRGTGRIPVAGLGDGDYLMGCTALWTAVANDIPLLVVVANNGSYFNDEVHQEKVARMRKRPIERKWIGQRIEGPRPDLAGLARDQGAVGIGPISEVEELRAAFEQGLAEVRAGRVCVIDVHVSPEYDKSVAAGVIGYAPGSNSERGA
jgi:thiamine pyrophosphate-dependent acetolactate synthase large subunit-like protein